MNEMIRRILNTSSRLDWEEHTAPILTDYMVRMKKAEYSEKYRKIVLEKTFKRHDKMVKEDEEGRRPLHRPKDWQKEERQKDKIPQHTTLNFSKGSKD